ncbi:MAG: alginate export family protein [Deltaproteobacteria bacterium]|nr:alginate export family protein [Deltaproteobacteria bacterium]
MRFIGNKQCLLGVAVAAALFSFIPASSAQPTSGVVSDTPSPFKYDVSLRARYEHADWIGALATDRQYGFGHSKLLFGAGYTVDSFRFYAQGQYFQLYNLPDGAVGPGAVYYLTNGAEENPGMVSLRQAFIEWKNSDIDLVAGRFLYSNGSEAMPLQPTLASLRSKRIAQRLIGPFDFTAGRSFDGARIIAPTSLGAFTAAYVMPTQGGFEVDLNLTIWDVRVPVVSWTAPFATESGSRDDVQIFAYGYSDDRSVLKTDNRPLDVRTADTDEIDIATVGAHWIHLWTIGDTQIDTLLWGAGQAGDWGEDTHRAYTFTAEIGVRSQALAWKPGLRIGYTYGSGDDDALDGDHETFFQMLPTARAYAATPFYNMQNMADFFLQITAQPLQPLTLKSELHYLQLAQSADLFYSGAGANERHNRFGYAGAASGGFDDVGTLLDIEATWNFTPHIAATIYYGHLFGSSAAKAAAVGGDDDIDYVFGEVVFKY